MKQYNLETPIYELNGTTVMSQMSSDNIESAVKYSELILTGLINLKTTDKNNTELYFNLAKKIQANPTAVEMSDEEVDICIDMLKNQNLVIKGRFLEMIKEVQK